VERSSRGATVRVPFDEALGQCARLIETRWVVLVERAFWIDTPRQLGTLFGRKGRARGSRPAGLCSIV
jgi:hypothetical protein